MNYTDILTHDVTKQFLKATAGIGGTLLAVFVLAMLVGPLAAILFTFLFLFTVTFIPVLTGLMGGATPNSIGKLQLILGAVAYNHHYLVQREYGWEWCPGDDRRVWIDGEWHDIEGGYENKSVLGWRPFGILRYKDKETWSQERVDTQARKVRGIAESDGGRKTEQVERGGFQEVKQPLVSGVSGTWILDLKRAFTRGIRKIGDIELIETAEEVIERGQVDDSRMGGFGPVVETFAFMLLGVLTGLGYILIA